VKFPIPELGFHSGTSSKVILCSKMSLTPRASCAIMDSVRIPKLRTLTREEREAVLVTNPGFIASIAAQLGCSPSKVSRTFAGRQLRNDPRVVRLIEARLTDALKELV